MNQQPARVVVVASSAVRADRWRSRVPGSSALVISDEGAELRGHSRDRALLEADVIVATDDRSLGWVVDEWRRMGQLRAPVLIIAADSRPETGVSHASVAGVLTADVSTPQLLAAIEAVRSGLRVSVPARYAPGDRTPVPDWDGSLEPEQLTAREQQVLELLVSGLRNRAIARQLGVSEHTVKFHVASILGKLGVNTRTQAVREGLRRGLVSI